MPNLTTTTSAVFIPEVWSVETLRAAERALVLAPLVKRYDSLVKMRGDTIHVPRVSNLSANDKIQDSEVTLQTVTETEVGIDIDQWKEVSFEIEDIVKVQSQYDLRSEYTAKAGYAIAQAVDTDLFALYASLTTTDVGTYGVDIGDDEIVAALQVLDEADAPLEDRFLVIAPSQKAAIMKLDKFVKADYLGQYDMPTPVKKGPNNRYLWGDIYGVPTYYTNQVPVTAGTPDQTHNILFHKEAFALAMQLSPRTQASYWQKDLAWLVTADTIYGVSVLRDDFGVEIRS
jgi:N4-gp56 family major capsid protein